MTMESDAAKKPRSEFPIEAKRLQKLLEASDPKYWSIFIEGAFKTIYLEGYKEAINNNKENL